jgi:hypothetical protein
MISPSSPTPPAKKRGSRCGASRDHPAPLPLSHHGLIGCLAPSLPLPMPPSPPTNTDAETQAQVPLLPFTESHITQSTLCFILCASVTTPPPALPRNSPPTTWTCGESSLLSVIVHCGVQRSSLPPPISPAPLLLVDVYFSPNAWTWKGKTERISPSSG